MTKFKCIWCGFEYEREMIYSSNPKGDKKGRISNQNQCPNCARIIPSSRIERIDNVVGAKHIHDRN